MTIAAGFVNRSGVLLCADTLVGDTPAEFLSEQNYWQSISGWRSSIRLLRSSGVFGVRNSALC